MIKGHGNDIYDFRDKIIADFSSNVVYKGPPCELIDFLANSVKNIVNYPEPDADSLRLKIAKYHKIDVASIIVTNGSTEAFYMLAHIFKGKKSSILIPSFSEYEDACCLYDHDIDFYSNSVFNSELKIKSDILWIGNPNNPDGKIYKIDEIKDFLINNPQIILIIDEAYIDLCINNYSCIDLINEFENIIIVRSLTKSFAIPGIRLGYILSSPEIRMKLLKVKIPWSVNIIALNAGNYIFDNYSELLNEFKDIANNSIILQRNLSQIKGLDVFNSLCNYFLLKLEEGKAIELKHFLIENYGILIRDAANFRGLDSSFFRVAVQDEIKNKLLIKGITEWSSIIMK